MARSMLKAGIETHGFDLNPTSLAALAKGGGIAAASATEAAKGCDILLMVVVNAEQTGSILFGAAGAAQAMKAGGVIISCATMSPDNARSLAKEASALGLLYIDAPMSGGAVKAASGDLTFMASGSPEAFERAQTVLTAIAAKVYKLGDTAGIGASFKMVNQLLAGVHIAASRPRPREWPRKFAQRAPRGDTDREHRRRSRDLSRAI